MRKRIAKKPRKKKKTVGWVTLCTRSWKCRNFPRSYRAISAGPTPPAPTPSPRPDSDLIRTRFGRGGLRRGSGPEGSGRGAGTCPGQENTKRTERKKRERERVKKKHKNYEVIRHSLRGSLLRGGGGYNNSLHVPLFGGSYSCPHPPPDPLFSFLAPQAPPPYPPSPPPSQAPQ